MEIFGKPLKTRVTRNRVTRIRVTRGLAVIYEERKKRTLFYICPLGKCIGCAFMQCNFSKYKRQNKENPFSLKI